MNHRNFRDVQRTSIPVVSFSNRISLASEGLCRPLSFEKSTRMAQKLSWIGFVLCQAPNGLYFHAAIRLMRCRCPHCISVRNIIHNFDHCMFHSSKTNRHFSTTFPFSHFYFPECREQTNDSRGKTWLMATTVYICVGILWCTLYRFFNFGHLFQFVFDSKNGTKLSFTLATTGWYWSRIYKKAGGCFFHR